MTSVKKISVLPLKKTPHSKRFNRFAALFSKVVVSGVSFFVVFQVVDAKMLWLELCKYHGHILAATLSLMVVQNLTGGLRWWYCCHINRLDLSVGWSLKHQLTGVFVALIFPGTLGLDGYRLMQAKLAGIRMPIAVTTLMQEKVFALVSLLVIVVLTPWYLVQGNHTLWPIYLASVVVVLLTLFLSFFKSINGPLARHQKNRLLDMLLRFADTVIVTHKPLACGLLLGLLSNGILLLVYAVLWFNMFDQWSSTYETYLFLPLILMTSLPLSFGGWGVRESLIVLLFSRYGYSAESLVSIGVAYGLIQTVAALPGGFGWLLKADVVKQEKGH